MNLSETFARSPEAFKATKVLPLIAGMTLCARHRSKYSDLSVVNTVLPSPLPTVMLRTLSLSGRSNAKGRSVDIRCVACHFLRLAGTEPLV